MKKFLSFSIAVFFVLIASAQKIEFKKSHIYIEDDKVEISKCNEYDFTAQFGQPDYRSTNSIMRLAYYKKGMEVFIKDITKKFSSLVINFEPDDKMASFHGELLINGNKITRSTTMQELKKMKGLKITKEKEGSYDFIDYEVETEDVTYIFTYRKGQLMNLTAEI